MTKIYDTLIEGCGYFSAGYASACSDSVICEEHQICDTGFYLPLRSFAYHAYEPSTEIGKELLELYSELGVFKENEQNLNRFESAFCKFILKKQIKVYLKCKIVSKKQLTDGTWDVTVLSNEGLTHIYAKRIISTKADTDKRRYTVLFVSDDIERDRAKILSAFDNSEIEPAFYGGRYALHISTDSDDANEVKLRVYDKWCGLDINAKILYMAPTLYADECITPRCDDNYRSPIEAFEAGYLSATEDSI